jgi:hypothetical protein
MTEIRRLQDETLAIDDVLRSALERTGAAHVPPGLAEVTARHMARLSALVNSLRSAGIDEAVVRHSTREVLKSYEEELVEALLLQNEDAGT